MDHSVHPSALGDITPRWLTRVLHDAGHLRPDVRVESLRPRRIGEGVGIMGQLHATSLHYDGDPGAAPDSVVVKMPSPFEENRQQGINLGMYEAEVRFYRELAERTAAGMPTIHFSEIVPGTADFTIVMEDLSHLELVDQARGMSVDQASAAVRVLADIHAAWWGGVDGDELAWIPTTVGPRIEMVSQMIPQLAPVFLERFAEHLPEGGADHVEWFAAHAFDAYRALAAGTPDTLIHSDYRVENLLFGDPSADEVVVIDWQGIARGPGMYDVAYLLGGSMDIELRRANEQSIVDEYRRRLGTNGIDYDADTAWNHYRLGNTVGGIATSMFTGATLDLANDRGFELVATMANRHFTAAIDLASRNLI